MTRRFLFACALLGLALATRNLATHTSSSATLLTPDPLPLISPPPRGFVLVTSVVDGDTIEIAGGQRVRYLGIDTPETVHPTKKVQCFGPEASAQNHHLVEGKAVRLVRDIEDTDTYNRLLRYVYLEDGTFVNLALVQDGYANVLTYPPNIAHARELQAAQNDARVASRGLWSVCGK